MAKRDKLTDEAVRAFCANHDGWAVASGDPHAASAPGALVKTYAFKHYGAAVGFAVHVGFAAEKEDHHPDLFITWGKVRVAWSTHDAGGITAVDTTMAERCDHIYKG